LTRAAKSVDASARISGNDQHSRSLKVVIVRDRPSSGGGIYNYYTSIAGHLQARAVFSDVGKPYSFYGSHRSPFSQLIQFTPLRLLVDWLSLVWKIICHWPEVVLVNACLDPFTFRSLRRDAVNVLIAGLFRRKVVVFWRGWENEFCGTPKGNAGWLCRCYKLAAAQVVLAGRFKEDLIRWGFKDPIYVETAVVGEEFISAPASRENGALPQKNLLFLSRVEVAKGIFELIEAYQLLKESDSDYTLTIAGDGPALQALRDRVTELGLADVNFTGFVTREAKLKCYRDASIFCFLSYSEGMPNAVLEAMAMGLPLISSDAGGLRDILTDGENGFIVRQLKDALVGNKFNPLEVAEAIRRLSNDAKIRNRTSRRNARYARKRFAAANVAQRLEVICANAAASSNGCRSTARSTYNNQS